MPVTTTAKRTEGAGLTVFVPARDTSRPGSSTDLPGGTSVISCPKCSKDNQDHYKFCLGCGAELPRDAGGGAPKPFSPQTPSQGVKAAAPVAQAAPPVSAASAAPAQPYSPPAGPAGGGMVMGGGGV